MLRTVAHCSGFVQRCNVAAAGVHSYAGCWLIIEHAATGMNMASGEGEVKSWLCYRTVLCYVGGVQCAPVQRGLSTVAP